MCQFGNRFVLLAIASLTLLLFPACGISNPGQALNWNSPAGGSSAEPSSVVVATAPATPSASGPEISWGSIWDNLNQNTAQVAAGQYALLQEFEGALTSQIDGLLTRTK